MSDPPEPTKATSIDDMLDAPAAATYAVSMNQDGSMTSRPVTIRDVLTRGFMQEMLQSPSHYRSPMEDTTTSRSYAETSRIRRLADSYKLADIKGEGELEGRAQTLNTEDLRAARALGIDITFIDDNAPFGEVCGYDTVMCRDESIGYYRPIFFAVRRVAAESVPGHAPGEPLLVSDNYKPIDGRPKHLEYKTPPRWTAAKDLR